CGDWSSDVCSSGLDRARRASAKPRASRRRARRKEAGMKLLAVEAGQWGSYMVSRYQQIQDRGIDVYLLTGIGTPGSWEPSRWRDLGSKKLPDMIAGATVWHE